MPVVRPPPFGITPTRRRQRTGHSCLSFLRFATHMTPLRYEVRAALGILTLLSIAACGPRRDCASECNCKQHGHCEEEKGKCVAGSHSECKRSEVCRVTGQCSAEKGRCVAGREDDCRASELCKKAGACTLSGERCVR